MRKSQRSVVMISLQDYQALEETAYLLRSPKNARRLLESIKEIQRTPFEGTGKPEPLRHGLSGYWSRRITDEHWMVYKVDKGSLHLAQLRYHY
jgi:toxin YoeB